jgi:hypothetical protein
VERAFGDFYALCSCGSRSLPMVTQHDARGWECPRESAEASVYLANEMWRRRVAEESLTPGSR